METLVDVKRGTWVVDKSKVPREGWRSCGSRRYIFIPLERRDVGTPEDIGEGSSLSTRGILISLHNRE